MEFWMERYLKHRGWDIKDVSKSDLQVGVFLVVEWAPASAEPGA